MWDVSFGLRGVGFNRACAENSSQGYYLPKHLDADVSQLLLEASVKDTKALVLIILILCSSFSYENIEVCHGK